MRRGAVPSEPDDLFGNVARILRWMTHLCIIFRSIFDFVGHTELNLPPLLCCNFVHDFGLKKNWGPRRSRTSQNFDTLSVPLSVTWGLLVGEEEEEGAPVLPSPLPRSRQVKKHTKCKVRNKTVKRSN